MTKRTINFNAGPAALPLPALERARAELCDFAGTGMSVMEHSHRGKDYEAVHHEAGTLLRRLMEVPESHEILFLQGGASLQFAMVPMNLLGPGTRADYVVNGAWGEKAIAEAKIVAAGCGASVGVAATTGVVSPSAAVAGGEGKEKSYVRVPAAAEISVHPEATYVHLTSNETIHGVQFATAPGAKLPQFSKPAVWDMSSDILWRRIDVSKIAMLYAGAQKNIGPSGVTVVIADKAFLESGRADIPKILQYRTHAQNDSLYNTPPTFAIYLMRNVLAWIEEVGGLARIEQWNREKAAILYGVIDEHASLYGCPIEPGSRSLMNVVFRLPNVALEETFVAEAKKRGMVGLKGHRSVGGIRVSMYNAVTVDWVATLATFMREFARQHM